MCKKLGTFDPISIFVYKLKMTLLPAKLRFFGGKLETHTFLISKLKFSPNSNNGYKVSSNLVGFQYQILHDDVAKRC